MRSLETAASLSPELVRRAADSSATPAKAGSLDHYFAAPPTPRPVSFVAEPQFRSQERGRTSFPTRPGELRDTEVRGPMTHAELARRVRDMMQAPPLRQGPSLSQRVAGCFRALGLARS